MGPEAEMVTDGAEMKRVDHPGSPGAESVVVDGAGAADRDGQSVDGDATGLLDTGLWGSGDASAVEPAQASVAFDLDQLVVRRLTRRDTDRQRRASPKRSASSRGRSIGAFAMTGAPKDVAWEATLRSVAHEQTSRSNPNGLAFAIEVGDLLQRRRISPPDHLLMLVVDASGSMAGELTAAARELAERALKSAYVERQRVAMIAFRARGAELLFGPTTRVERARRALDKLPLGGATPLGRGLDLAHKTLRRASVQTRSGYTTVLVISDGDANVGDRNGYGSAFLDVEQASRKLVAIPNTEIVLLDTTERGKDERPALWLAEQLRARHIKLAMR